MRPLPGRHPHLLDDEVAVLRLEPVGGRRAPRAAHERAALDALEERRVELQPRRALLDDVPDVDHGDPLAAAEGGEVLDVLDDVLLLRVLRGAGLGEGAAVDDHVVLEVLDDQRAARRRRG